MRKRTKIIQEGLLNLMADILKAMYEPETVHTGKHGYFSNPEILEQY